MIKNFKRSDIQTTSFVVTKPWILSSVQTNNSLLLEQSASSGIEIPLALEFIDYNGGDTVPFINRTCNLSIENYSNNNEIIYEEGEKIDGVFYPDVDIKNSSGTYKRLIYSQIKNAFYNNYQNPVKMFGLEHIDFQLSGIKKFLTDRFRLFSVTKDYFGEKMVEYSVNLVDNSLDESYIIKDDGKGNLFAKKNLFSKIQEVKKFSNNVIESGSANIICDEAITTTTTTTTTTTRPPAPTTPTPPPITGSSTTTTTTTETTTGSPPNTPPPPPNPPPPPVVTTTAEPPHTPNPPTTGGPVITSGPPSTPPPPPAPPPGPVVTPDPGPDPNRPPACQAEYDCYWFSEDYIPIVHWKPYNDSCECTCVRGECNLRSVCQEIFGLGVWLEDTVGDRDVITRRLLTKTVYSKAGTADCKEPCLCGSGGGCEDEPVGGNSDCCKAGTGRNLPSAWETCWEPVLDALQLAGCLTYTNVESNTKCADLEGTPPCCDKQMFITITWLF